MTRNLKYEEFGIRSRMEMSSSIRHEYRFLDRSKVTRPLFSRRIAACERALMSWKPEAKASTRILSPSALHIPRTSRVVHLCQRHVDEDRLKWCVCQEELERAMAIKTMALGLKHFLAATWTNGPLAEKGNFSVQNTWRESTILLALIWRNREATIHETRDIVNRLAGKKGNWGWLED